MRLSVRRIVVLPQPDGPMNAVTERSCTSNVTSRTAAWPS